MAKITVTNELLQFQLNYVFKRHSKTRWQLLAVAVLCLPLPALIAMQFDWYPFPLHWRILVAYGLVTFVVGGYYVFQYIIKAKETAVDKDTKEPIRFDLTIGPSSLQWRRNDVDEEMSYSAVREVYRDRNMILVIGDTNAISFDLDQLSKEERNLLETHVKT